MAWQMPTTGQWTSGTGMTVSTDINVGSYTAEQWAAMQQQHWQQWAQWQQQYATWQSQYGSKYVEQMQAMQAMGAMPPLPPVNAAPPPAPPPPDKPPPPPHENNQPLYDAGQQQPAPVAAPGQNNATSNTIPDSATGNNQNRPYATDIRSEAAQSSFNSEALKTLAEEEKAFDIQFQKWEEEIENWKKANVNHPDKKAYEEYEQKFESCRAQLLERRQQMKQKRAKLLDNVQQSSHSTLRPNISTNMPPPVHNASTSNFTSHKDLPKYQPGFKKITQISQITIKAQRVHNKNFESQDSYDSFSASNKTGLTTSNMMSTEPFLQTREPLKGIPGLDLVPESDKVMNRSNDIIDITEEPTDKQVGPMQSEPDYSKISKGINNILGDEKIMNILSMVQGQTQMINNQSSYPNNPSNYHNNNWDRNETQNNNYSQMSYMNQQNDYSMQQENSQASNFVAGPSRGYNNMSDDMTQDQYSGRTPQYNNQGLQTRTLLPRPNLPQQMQPNIRPNFPMRSILDPIPPPNDFNSGGFNRRALQEIPPNQGIRPSVPVRPPPLARPAWVDEPLFTPSIIVEYEHKPLRLKARDFIEPVHTFDYNHQSKDNDGKKKDFEKEAEEMFMNASGVYQKEDRYTDRHRDLYHRDGRTLNRDHLRDSRSDHHLKLPMRNDFEERRRYDNDIRDKRYDDRRREDREKFGLIRREDIQRERDRDREDTFRERELERIRDRERDLDGRIRERDRDIERDREIYKDRHRDYRRSKSRDKDNRKRGHSKDNEIINISSPKKYKDESLSDPQNEKPKHMIMIDDILEPPGRHMRPEKIVIILRGPPGSGKSYLAKLIREREAEHGGTVRVMSIDDYFMQEGEIEEKDPSTGKIIKKPSLKYEYDEKLEESYLFSLKRAFKRSITDGYFTFLIYDAVNDHLKCYADIWNFARQNNFQVYICTMDLDPQLCYKRNIHNRKLQDIVQICSTFFPTPDHHIQLDATTLLQSASIPEVQMEDVEADIAMEDAQEPEVTNSFTSKWEKMDDAAQLARLDGISKPLRPSQLSMEDYLQLDDWKPNTSKPGKKTVRWADIEERRQQEKMRAIGFVVGQTDWNRMTDPTMGSSALTQTKYIERVRRT